MTHPRHPSPLILYCTFIALMVLLLSTVGFSKMQLGVWNTPIGLAISIIKTLLIVVLFMNMLNSSGSVRLAACSAILWLSFAMMFVISDYHTRGWDETPEQQLATGSHVETYDRINFQPESEASKTVEEE